MDLDRWIGRSRYASAPLARAAPTLALALLAASACRAGVARAPAMVTEPSERIRVNQVGFHPAAAKIAIVLDTTALEFAVRSERGDTVLVGPLSSVRSWTASGEHARQADLSSIRRPGTYVIEVPGVGRSPRIVIDSLALRELARAALEAFHHQRASTALAPELAGPWSRAAGHPDTNVLVHPSAAGPGRPAGTRIAAPRGWYDAGDYNKYIVNSGISTYTLLALVDHFPGYAARLRLDVPERGNGLPDVLDETLWNLRWMLAMQDPSDGGVYHKLTTAEFEGMVMPAQATAQRWVVQKSTAATLNFAAVMAHASLVARRFPAELPGLADTLVHAALRAWAWARTHPDSLYDQGRLNAHFAPPINTGAYGDRTLDDERAWAAAELWLATRADSFLVAAGPLLARSAPPLAVPSWSSVASLGAISLLDHRGTLPMHVDVAGLEQRMLALADSLVVRARRSGYGVPMLEPDFVWGSNAVAANQGLMLVQAFRLSGDPAYLRVAEATLDYLLGRNATGYSFVTGFGWRSPMHPHHRPSEADGVAAPVPGFLVGGPNPGRQDGCAGYRSILPAAVYVDDVCSYASNEVAINWNAPLAYLVAAIDAIHSGS